MPDENYNSGNRNSGYCNSGNFNSGDYNSGYRNSGDCNSGNRNSGCYNSGDYNSGYRNSGYCNSGNFNSGNRNSGNYNSGNRNSGFFCTKTPQPAFFDLPVDMRWGDAARLVPWVDLPVGCKWVAASDMSDEEKAANPNHTTIGGYLKAIELDYHEAWQQLWPTLEEDTRQRFLGLPNFDAEKFLAITGVDVREKEQELPPKELVVNGARYVLIEEAGEVQS